MPQGGVAINGGALKLARIRKGWGLRDVTAATAAAGHGKNSKGVDFGDISRYERGEVHPHPRTLKALADALGVTVDDLLADEAKTAA